MDADTDGKVDFTEFCDFFADMPSPDLQLMTQKWIYGEGWNHFPKLVCIVVLTCVMR